MILGSSGDFGLSYILEIVALVPVAWFVWRYPVPYLRKAMDAKRASISSQLSAGDEARAEAAALVQLRRAELDEANKEAQSIVEAARQSAAALERDGDRLAEEDYERAIARARAEVEGARSRVENEIMDELAEVILNAASLVVRAELNNAVERRLLDQVIATAQGESELSHR